MPHRGEKRALLELAERNAAMAYQSRFNAAAMGSFEALDTLRSLLNLPALPRRIECFDISTIQGSETVGGVVNPTFSPDGGSVAFYATLDRTLRRMPIARLRRVAE